MTETEVVTADSATPETPPGPAAAVHRVEVWPAAGEPDPRGAAAAAAWGPTAGQIRSAGVYLIEAELAGDELARVADELLADPVSQRSVIGASDATGGAVVEVHYLPGVMDPVAASAADAIAEMLPRLEGRVRVRTGRRFDITPADGGWAAGDDVVRGLAERLGNPVIESIHLGPHHPDAFPRGEHYDLRVTHVPVRDLDDDALRKLSREGHLFLSLDEMRAVRDHFRSLNREPSDIELETLAQTWSEHCVHKTLKSTIRYRPSTPAEPASAGGSATDTLDIFHNKPGHDLHDDGSVTIHNLLKSTIAAATAALRDRDPAIAEWLVSVFDDNSGIVRFDEQDGICIKVETHNHPSAIEPYGGAATGIGGCIRDILGTGLAARPIANTDVFCVAPPTTDPGALPGGVIHPRRMLERVVAGVRDYGNRMGIPTVNGAVAFDDDYLGNPLVYCGCIGLIPLDKCFGDAQPGDRIIALGGATGRDGIHGATFSSAELTDTHADEFGHAVQIGNPIEQKRMADVILQARDHADGTLFSAITDCGAGGFSSAVGEMGEKVGAAVQLDRAPLKYDGLSYTEVWISEAQERMVLAVPPDKVATLKALCDGEDVRFADLGQFGWTDSDGAPLLSLTWEGTEVGRLPMRFLHDGIPTPVREAIWPPVPLKRQEWSVKRGAWRDRGSEDPSTLDALLFTLLSHPDIASKHWIIRQYDHEVQGSSTVKPLVGPGQDGPSDAAVVRPKLGSVRGISLSCGLAPHLSEKADAEDGDSYQATLHAIDEAVRNAVCVGADPSRVAVLDNFCWPSCDDPAALGSLVRAAEACYDGAMAYGTPFVSGKDSLNNQFTTDDGRVITIPPTLLVTAMGIVNDVTRCVTMDAKAAGHALLIVGETTPRLGGSHLLSVAGVDGVDARVPRCDLRVGPEHARAVAGLIAAGYVAAAHDCSDGGLLVAAAEMAFAGRIGLDLDLSALPTPDTPSDGLSTFAACFAETPHRYLLEVAAEHVDAVVRSLTEAGISHAQVGTFADHGRLTLRTDRDGRVLDASLDDLRAAWRAPLDW